ncbi:MAG TPA: phage holin family protein [Actinomycetota bacterium]|nr:phage holin family protein [Actinomycetota bacterium]
MTEASTRSTAELVMDVADDLRLLVRKEIELARIELVEGLRAQVIGAGIIFLALIGMLPALLFGLFSLALWLPFSREVAFALVGLGLLVFAVGGTLIGIGIMRRRRPRLDRSVASIKEDVKWAREQLTS